MEEPLTILYTANLRGSLERLSRLHTFLRQLKNQRPADEPDVMLCMVEPVVRRTLLLDAGNACTPEAWHCAATGGRSALIILDAMGYHAANVSGYLTAEGRARLDANYLGMALVDESHPWHSGDVTVTCDDFVGAHGGSSLPGDERLRVVLPVSQTSMVGEGLRPSPMGVLHLPLMQAGQVGVIHVTWENGLPVLGAHDILSMPPNTPPDPTIAATVEFVLAEARRLER